MDKLLLLLVKVPVVHVDFSEGTQRICGLWPNVKQGGHLFSMQVRDASLRNVCSNLKNCRISSLVSYSFKSNDYPKSLLISKVGVPVARVTGNDRAQ